MIGTTESTLVPLETIIYTYTGPRLRLSNEPRQQGRPSALDWLL